VALGVSVFALGSSLMLLRGDRTKLVQFQAMSRLSGATFNRHAAEVLAVGLANDDVVQVPGLIKKIEFIEAQWKKFRDNVSALNDACKSALGSLARVPVADEEVIAKHRTILSDLAAKFDENPKL
jgi:hypothetical protein